MTYPITGITAGLGPGARVPVRRDIDEWYASTDPNDQLQVSLFIMALLSFQQLDPQDTLSYFQVAGIHGQPLVAWDENTAPQTNDVGYCTHNSVLFATWHRPYLLLYEQRIYEEMKNLITTFPQGEQANLNAAADSWRLPYWDWAAKKNDGGSIDFNIPNILKQPTIQVITPTGPQMFNNPTYKFSTPNGQLFRDLGIHGDDQEGVPSFYEDCVSTSRWNRFTSGNQWKNGVENNNSIIATLENPSQLLPNLGTLADCVYRLFTSSYASSYAAFSTTKYAPGQAPPDFISLEGIHNVIHEACGGFTSNANGHMSLVPVAAFDPIFWMHHCNVDRLAAIFQQLNDQLWFDTQDQELSDDGTWSIPSGATDSPQTPLAPFHRDANGTYYNSNDARWWQQLGYTYPELQPWLPQHQVNGMFNEAKYKADINAAITQLYDSTTAQFLSPQVESQAFLSRRVLPKQPALQPAKEIPAQKPTVEHAPSAEPPKGAAPQQPLVEHAPSGVPAIDHVTAPDSTQQVKHDDYIVNVIYKKYALGGHPFKIHIYLGEHEVGSVFNFSTPSAAIGRDDKGCINCHRQEESLVKATGQVPITQALIKLPGVEATEHHSVCRYLIHYLRWKVTTRTGEEVPPANLTFIEVSVAKGSGTHYAEDEKLSHYHSYTPLPECTHGKHGGLQQASS